MRRRARRLAAGENGLTLIELIIEMMILLVVLAAITGVFVSGMHSETNVQSRLQSQSDARQALNRMRQDMHCAFAVQTVAQNSAGGFSVSLTEFYNQCKAVDSSSTSSSQVYLEWCTVPDPSGDGSFDLYRTNTLTSTSVCDTSTASLQATDIVEPQGGWPQNSSVSLASGTTWAGNIWPTSRTCASSFLATQAVDFAVNPEPVKDPGETYELKDEIALRNSTRCGTGSGGRSAISLTVSAPSTTIAGTAIAASSITATLSGSDNPTAQISFTVFGPDASAPTDCTSGGSVVGTATPTADGTYSSSLGFTPTQAGDYWWFASMDADSNNTAAESGCPPSAVTVVLASKASPTLTVSTYPTDGSPGTQIAASSLASTLAGSSGSTTGTITLKVFGPQSSAPSSCTSGGTTVGTVTPSSDGNWSPNAGYTPSSVGTYWWYASFAGDALDNAATSTCGSSMPSTSVASAPTLSTLKMFDTDHDGKVDQVTATFSGSLDPSCTSTTGWTLANVPSGGSLNSVSVSGSTATLTLNEGSGARNTAVGTFTVALSTSSCIKDMLGRHSSFTATAPADDAAPALVSMTMKDVDTDGYVDQVQAVFSESLASSTATSPWTLTNVPSGGSLKSVSVSGSTATLTLNEGSGAQNTAVGSFKLALASSSSGIRDASGNQSSFSATAPSDGAAPVPILITSTNKSGGTSGKADAGDTITVTFSEPLAALSSSTSTVTLSTSSGSGKAVQLAISGLSDSAFQIGKKNSYLTGSSSTGAVFGPGSSSLSEPTSTQVRVTLGTWNGKGSLSTGSYTSGQTSAFVPSSSITDAAGNAAAGSLAVTIGFF